MSVKVFLVLVLVLDWTQCLPQGAGAPTAMMRSRMTGFQKKMTAVSCIQLIHEKICT